MDFNANNTSIQQDLLLIEKIIKENEELLPNSEELKKSINRVSWYVSKLEKIASSEIAEFLSNVANSLEYNQKNNLVMSEKTLEEIVTTLRVIVAECNMLQEKSI